MFRRTKSKSIMRPEGYEGKSSGNAYPLKQKQTRFYDSDNSDSSGDGPSRPAARPAGLNSHSSSSSKESDFNPAPTRRTRTKVSKKAHAFVRSIKQASYIFDQKQSRIEILQHFMYRYYNSITLLTISFLKFSFSCLIPPFFIFSCSFFFILYFVREL